MSQIILAIVHLRKKILCEKQKRTQSTKRTCIMKLELLGIRTAGSGDLFIPP